MIRELVYAKDQGVITLEQKEIVGIAMERSKAWRHFLDTNPLMKAQWYNDLIDDLVKVYPDEFCIVKPK